MEVEVTPPIDRPFVAAVMIIGKKTEPFLGACMESVSKGIDLLVLNDNSALGDSPNMETVRRSMLFSENRVRVIPSEFLGFGPCRTLCLDYLREHHPEGTWVLYLDSDEVHPPSIEALTRGILPALPRHIGIVDGYFYQFYLTPRHYLSLDRRHNMLFRFNTDITWEGKVHEKPVNLRGTRLALPYRYFHYGYLADPGEIMGKWSLYAVLGDQGGSGVFENPDYYFRKDAAAAMPFRGAHPEAAEEALLAVEEEHGAHFRHFEGMIKELERQWGRTRRLKHLNFEMRMHLRGIEALVRFFFRKGFIRSLRTILKTG
ncbi:MAG: hypothetical protein RDV48_25025 [Candidatus Eremiobacteraeota bacterium]|nr:hypothetical protein [Candidatus Eremiobacteraeota bacterium]